MIDELVLVESRFLFLQQQQYIVLVTPSLWWHIWGAVLAVDREAGGLLCANNKLSTPRYSPLGKPAHPTDQPTGTKTQLLSLGGLLCANNKLSTPRYSPLGKPAHPTDQPTGTKTQLLSLGGSCLFFFACALRLLSRSNRTSRTTTKMSPYFCIIRCHHYLILLLPS